MLRHWLFSVFAFIGTITTTEIGREQLDRTQETQETQVVQISSYQYDRTAVNRTYLPADDSVKPKSKVGNETQRCPQWEPALAEYGLYPVRVFSYIAWRESGCRIKAINAKFDEQGNVTWTLNKDGSIDRGLLQINSSWRSVTASVCGTKKGDLDVLLTLDCNLKVAKYLLDNGGLGHWSM